MELRKPLVWIFLLLLLLGLWAQAAGDRVAMVLETKGKNILVSGKSEMRTLQVLNDGDLVDVSDGAVLRLSYFKSGSKEKISGPCRVKLGPMKSEKVSGKGKVETQSARNASTDLDESTNLRRTGGAMQASSGIVPENELAFLRLRSASDESAGAGAPPPPVPAPTKASARVKVQTANESAAPAELVSTTGFTGLSYSYLYPEEVSVIAWNQKGDYRFELETKQGTNYSDKVSGERVRIPVGRLVRGEVHKAILKRSGSETSQFFRILSKEQTREYWSLVAQIKEKEKADPRALYGKLIYLNARLGLLTRARATTREALKAFPNDEGFKAVWKELNQKLNLPE